MKFFYKKSPKFVPRGPIDYDSSLDKVMAWRRTGDKPLSETMMAQYIDAYMRHSASRSFNQKSLFWRNGGTNIFNGHLLCTSTLCDAKWSYFQWKRQANGLINNSMIYLKLDFYGHSLNKVYRLYNPCHSATLLRHGGTTIIKMTFGWRPLSFVLRDFAGDVASHHTRCYWVAWWKVIFIFYIAISWPVVRESVCFNLLRTAYGKVLDKFNRFYTYDIRTSDHLHVPVVEWDLGKLAHGIEDP